MGMMPDFLEENLSDGDVEIQKLFEGDLVFNGVNAETGDYGLAPMPVEEFASKIQGKAYYKVLQENRALQTALKKKHSSLDRLGQRQWVVLFENLTEERKRLLLEILTPEQVETFVKLIQEAKEYHELRGTLAIVYDVLAPQKFEQLLAYHKELAEIQINSLKEKLYAGISEEHRAILKSMLDEQWNLLEDELHTGELGGKAQSPFPVIEGVDPTDLKQAGWGIIFPAAIADQYKDAIKQALAPLLTLRQEQAGALYRVYEGEMGYRPGETKSKFLQRHRVNPGPADPKEMPFYVLLIGSPEEIPYEFQYQLDVMRGVGRLDFGDDMAAYARYAQNVVLAETGAVKLPRQATFFGVENQGDKATQLSAKYLLQPLYEELQTRESEKTGITLEFDWQFTRFLKEKATKSQLQSLLGSAPDQTPALLLTASHGMEFKYDPNNPDKQLKYQGSLLCQDWKPGGGSVDRNAYFAGEDVPEDANLLGMIAFLFACFGCGTPKFDQFEAKLVKEGRQIAPYNFIADLPKQLLNHGALAVLGHVERAWGYSFVSPAGFVDNQAFLKAVRHLLNGDPVGWATDPGFNARYAEMSSDLSSYLQDEKQLSNSELVQHWTASNDARGYVVLGDPAVRIPFAKGKEKAAARPALDTALDLDAYLKKQYNYVAGVGGSRAAAPTAGAAEIAAAQNFGLFDRKDKEEAPADEAGKEGGPLQSFQKIAADLAEKIGAAIEEITSLEVNTYTSSNLEGVIYDAGEKHFKGQIRMRARTYISFDGDMEVCLPVRDDGSVDRELWQIHSEMVKQAQVNRTEFLKTLSDLAARLVGK